MSHQRLSGVSGGCPSLQRLRRWRWLVWLQSLLLLTWSLCPPWTARGETVEWTGGTWHIHGSPQTWEGIWSYQDFVPDADGDCLPDEFDPYPAEAHNRSCLFPGGVWAIDGQERYFESAWFDAYDGTLADADGDGLPDLLDPHPQTQHNLSARFSGGTWVVDGVLCFWEGLWLPCAYESSTLPDADADGLPDLLDAHPQDAGNHSFWFNGGIFTRNDLTLALRAGHYAGSAADTDGDGLPDALEDLFLHPSNYGTLQHWPGGSFLIHGEWNTYGPVGYFAPEAADRDGDGIPDELDAAPDDTWNGSYFQWQGGQFRVHGVLCDFSPGWYGGDSQDADGDGLPNGADPLPSDPDNNSAWWAGGTFLVDAAYQEFPGQWHQANAGDADQDGLPEDLDPYPGDAQNPAPEPAFTWAGGTFIIDGAERVFASGSHPGGWADADGDLIPDSLDPCPADAANNSAWWSGGHWVVNGVAQAFAACWHRANAGDADQDGIPEDLDPYPGDPLNPTPAPPQTFYWQGGVFRIDGVEQVFEAGLREGVWADADGDLLPDSLDPCPGDAANNSVWWLGGTWLVHGQEAVFDARWQRADSPDGDGDGLPDDLDPLPGDPWNGSGWYWPEEPQLRIRINDQDHTFTRQLYLTPRADADADGIPDVADPLPQDAYNGNDSDADGLCDSVEVLYPGVLNPQYAEDVLQERADGVSYLRAYEYNGRARAAGRSDLMLALDAPIPAERDSDQDSMGDRFEARHGLNPFDENDAVDSFTADYALNAEKAAWARSPWEPVTPEEYTTVTGQDWSDFFPHHNDSLSYAENDWDGDGVSNRDEVLIFRTSLRQAASRPTEAALLEAMIAGRVSQTTLLNHPFLLPVQDSCGCSASGCPIQGCYCSNGSCVPVEEAPPPAAPAACGCGYTLMTPSQCGCASSQSCSTSTPCTPMVGVDEALPPPPCACPNYNPSVGNACGCSQQCYGEMNDPSCRHYTMDCACIFAGLCTSKPPVYDAEGVEIVPGVPCQCAYNCDAGAPARYACTCGCSSCPSSTDPSTYAQGCPNPTPAPGPNQIKVGNLPCDPVVTLEVKQENMPNFGVTDSSTDMASPYSMATISDGGVAYITGQPAMPQLKAAFPGLAANINVDWKLEIKTERSERGGKDDKNYPISGFKTLPGNQSWDIGVEFGTDFVGGACKLFYKVGGGVERTFEFFIRGKNSLDVNSRNYAISHAGAANHRAGWAICQHESRQGLKVHNQFNASGSSRELPNFSGNYPTEDGWGIAQLDRPMGVSATRDDVYSWKSNINKLFQELDSKRADAERFIRWIRNKWGSDTRWEDPPASWTVSLSSFTYLELASMVLYNGASGVPWSSGVNDNGGNASFRSPWSFDPGRPAGSRWQFHDNLNPVSNHPYATTVIVDEWENGLQIQE